MLRRQARQRREYIYKKSVEDQERTIYDRKKRLKNALQEGKPIPTELRRDEGELRKAIEFDDEAHEKVTTHVDDEYAWSGIEDPKIMVTTSHSPSSRLKQFAKELRLIFPNSQRLNRGNYVMSQLVQACRANDVTDLIIAHEHRGEPDGLVVCHLPYGPTAYFTLSNTVMRHDIPNIGTMSEVFPHLIFDKFSSKLGERVKNILKYLFPVPKDESKRVITFANQDDYISFRHHSYKKVEGKIELSEIGPRFEMKVYEIRLGTVDQTEADVEWRLKPYMNTAKKRKFLD
ncbi:U3 small nucleolar ribonucleoprotein protein IMP4-like [Dendronephthya gigantea]|uniref:U3 small nucleolar ribonucleoprotein protein IMP4-like n=1 Tax=Dendronephthya gigantea TaxID=151771 RepID=UPI00106B72CA|nr:U3 small nucleolar ribonucleoprotein protein IMP4-like [Dendronephthya gigantea]